METRGHATAVAMVSFLVIISFSRVAAKSCEQYQEATLSVVNKVIWPTSRDIAVSQVPPPEFAANVNGRVVPVGVFNTNLGALEYFFRLAGPVDLQDTFSSRVSEANVRWMVCDNQKRQVAFEGLFRFTSPANPALNYNISAMGVFSFNKDGKICAYDWDLRRLGFTVETTYERNLISTVFGGNTAAYQEQVRQGICSVATTLCNGTNTQYDSMAECMEILSQKPFGDWDRVDQDNVACRQLHSFLVPVRQDVHCPHIGPDGGGKCVEHPINSLFTDNFAACTEE